MAPAVRDLFDSGRQTRRVELGEIEKDFGPKGFAKLSLGTIVDRDDSQIERVCVLEREMA